MAEHDTYGAGPLPVRRLAAWLVAVLVPALVFTLGDDSELFSADNGQRWRQLRATVVLGGGCLMWAFRLVRPYIACLLMLLCLLALGIVKSSHVLMGFSSSTFFMVISVFIMGTMIIRSGLLARVGLLLERACTTNVLARHLLATASICGLTTVMSDDRSRALAWLDLQETLFPVAPQDHRRAQVVRSVMTMTAFWVAPVFLTGSTANLALYAALPVQRQAGLGWLQWLEYSAVALATLMIGAIVVLLWHRKQLLEPPEGRTRQARDRLRRQQLIGRISPRESIVICAVLGWTLAHLTTATHAIDHRLVGLAMLAILFLGDISTRRHIEEFVDWRFLLCLAAVIGITNMAYEVELAAVLGRAMPELGGAMHEPVTVVVVVALVSAIISALVPHGALLVGMLVVPIAVENALSSWVLIFAVLMADSSWMSSKRGFTRRSTAAMLGLRLIAVLVSIPFWLHLGIL